MFNQVSYKEFASAEISHQWGIQHYALWLKEIQPQESRKQDDHISVLLYAYCGNMNRIYNSILRGISHYDPEHMIQYIKEVEIIKNEINKYMLSESIVVYRYTEKDCFKFCFDTKKIKKGAIFIEKGFMSTSLVPELLKKIKEEYKYNCILKLYLPKGAKGVYVSFEKSCLNEAEFILPPNSKFQLVNKSFDIRLKRFVYECKLVEQ